MASVDDSSLESYLNTITRVAQEILGSRLIGFYLHGSLVQNAFDAKLSDIDILGVVDGPLDEQLSTQLTSRLSHDTCPVPAVGLELIMCTAEAVRTPEFDFPFVFALSTGSDWGSVTEAAGTASDILINIELCRQAGRALIGPPPEQAFVPIDRDLLCRALIDEIHWHQRELSKEGAATTLENAVLNAARSLHGAKTGRIVSKSEGGQVWLQHDPSDDLVVSALKRRGSPHAHALDLKEVREFLDRVSVQIEALR